MKRGSFPISRPETVFHFCSTIAVVLLLPWVGLAAGAATQGTLEQTYLDANQLAATPEGAEQAVAGYRAVVEMHLANERIFDSALRELARCYMDSGQIEEGVQFFLTLGQKMYGQRRPDTFKEILNQFKLKYPDQVDKAIARLQSSSGREAKVASTVPAQDLSNAILQRNDEDLRDKALSRLRETLGPQSSDKEKAQGLATLRTVLPAKFDRKPFHDLVLPLLVSPTPEVRALALRCLPGLEAPVTDLALVVPMAQDESPKVRREVGAALIQIGKGQEPEKVIPTLMQLLQDEDREIVEWTIRSMWGQYSSPEFDALLIRLAGDRQLHHNVIYFCLSTMKPKSVAVCRRLLEELAEPDSNNSGRAAWGLTYGVPEEARQIVEEGLLKALPQEMNSYTREQELRALRAVATDRSRGYLQSVADSQLETDKIKQMARGILTNLDSGP